MKVDMYIVADSHEDIAFNMLNFDRDYLRSVEETRSIEKDVDTPKINGDTLLGWPEYVSGCVKLIFSTLFIVPKKFGSEHWGRMVYSDEGEAETLIQKQIATYQRLINDNSDKFILITESKQLMQQFTIWQKEIDSSIDTSSRTGLVMLLEGAEAIQDLSVLQPWWEFGVRIVGPVWAGTRYCGGTHNPGSFTKEGFALLDEMARWDYILDVSHMSERSVLEALDYYEGNVIASHANAKSVINNVVGERHLTDQAITFLAERNGVIGVVPYNKFLINDWTPGMDRQCVSIEMLVDHIDHICQITGSDAHVGIGTDFDGGFGFPDVPREINSVADIQLIAEALSKRGFSKNNIENIMGYNWINKMIHSLP